MPNLSAFQSLVDGHYFVSNQQVERQTFQNEGLPLFLMRAPAECDAVNFDRDFSAISGENDLITG